MFRLTRSHFPGAHRGRRNRRPLVFLAVLTLAVSAAIVQSGPARASVNPFDIDGNVPDAGAVELSDLFGSVKELGPKNGSPTKIGVIHDAATPMLEMTNPNAQVDLRRAWVDLQRVDGDDWLYFAWERDSNNGSGFIAFEFMRNDVPTACNDYNNTTAQLIASCNPWADRAGDPQPGDFLILWDQQGGSTDLYKRVWSGPSNNLVLGAPVALSTNPDNAAARYSNDNFRGEAALNLTALGLTDGDECQAFANVIPSTVTGNSDTADYKDTILDVLPPISNCEATIVTTPKTGAGAAIPDGGLSIGTGVVAVQDSAEISLSGGSAPASGSISFHLCKMPGNTGTCTEGGTSIGSTSIDGESFPVTVSSPTAYVTSAGRYCWRAEWPGDETAGIPGASDAAETECFVVNPVTPTLSTSAGNDIVLGGTVTDRATLGGTATQPADPVINLDGTAGPAAGGTITFKLYGPSSDACGSLVHTSAPVSVSGDGNYDTPNPQFAPTAIGDYHWVAVYSGSPNTNGLTHNADCDDTAEDVTVTDVPSSMSTAQSWVPNDSATVSATAGGPMAGTVHFELYGSADCTGDTLFTENRSVSGASPQQVATTNTTPQTATGEFSWRVRYDSTNPAQRDIPWSCHETSSLTVTNGETISSP